MILALGVSPHRENTDVIRQIHVVSNVFFKVRSVIIHNLLKNIRQSNLIKSNVLYGLHCCENIVFITFFLR